MRLIDADALRLSHCVECTLYGSGCPEKNGGECDRDCIGHIDAAPTVAPVKHGRWIQKGLACFCSFCGEPCNEIGDRWAVVLTDYCGCCGARMDEVKE